MFYVVQELIIRKIVMSYKIWRYVKIPMLLKIPMPCKEFPFM